MGILFTSHGIRLMGIRLSTIGFTHRIGRLIGGNNCCWWLQAIGTFLPKKMLTEKTGDVSCKPFELLLVNCWVTPFLGMINMTIGRQKTNRSTFNAQHFKGRFGIWLYNGSTIEGLGDKIGFIYKCNTCIYIYVYIYTCISVCVCL